MFMRREHLVALVVAVSLAASAQPSHAQWNVNGVPLCTAVGDQYWPTSVSDGAGGAIATWADHRSGQSYFDIYAQRLLASGVVDPLWTAANGNADGTPLCTASGGYYATIATDGAGGAIIAWQDYRAPGTSEIYAQHVLASGAVDPAWPVNGRGLCTAAVGPQSNATIVADGSGGAIIAWADNRNYPNLDILHLYAQHVLSTGEVDPAWPADGRELTTDNGGNDYGNAAVAAFYPWPADGRGLAAAGYQYLPTIVTDGSGGAIVTWMDSRNGNMDVYAQRVSGSGGVAAVAMGAPVYSFAVRAPHPNPANSQAAISFDLANPQPVSVRVYDVAGRLVRTLAAGGELGTGSHSLTWNGASDSGALAHAGIYFIRVSAGSAVQTRRVAIIR